MKKISYRLVYNRKNCLNANGKALYRLKLIWIGKRRISLPTFMCVPKNGMPGKAKSCLTRKKNT